MLAAGQGEGVSGRGTEGMACACGGLGWVWQRAGVLGVLKFSLAGGRGEEGGCCQHHGGSCRGQVDGDAAPYLPPTCE